MGNGAAVILLYREREREKRNYLMSTFFDCCWKLLKGIFAGRQVTNLNIDGQEVVVILRSKLGIGILEEFSDIKTCAYFLYFLQNLFDICFYRTRKTINSRNVNKIHFSYVFLSLGWS